MKKKQLIYPSFNYKKTNYFKNKVIFLKGFCFYIFPDGNNMVVVLATQLCLTFCNPMNCSLPGSSVHGISISGWVIVIANTFSDCNF